MREHQIGSLASHWRTTAALIAVGLGLLSAIPTGGSGLIAGVAAGAAVLGTAYSLATLYDDYQDYSLASAEHLSTLDQAEAISQEEPSLMWLAGDLLDVGLNIVGAASAFKTLRGAMVAAEKGGLKALPELIKTTERSGLGIASRSRVVSTVLQRTGNQSLEQMLKAIREGLAAAKPAPGKEALLDAIKAAADKLAKKQIARIGPSGAPMRAQIADIVRALEASAWAPNLVSRTVCMSSPRAATGGDSRRAATKTTASSAACSPKPSGPARRSTRPPQAPTERVDAADAEIAWTGAISPMARRPLWTCSFRS